MKTKMNKKAIAGHTLLAITIGLTLTLLIGGSLWFFIGRYLSIKADTFQIEAGLFTQRALYSASGFAYFDESTGRVYPGIIDGRLIEDTDAAGKRLLEAINYGSSQKYLAAKISAGNKTIYYNKPMYDSWLPRVGLAGAGSARELVLVKYALVRQGSLLEPTVFTFSVLKPGEAA